MTVLHDRHFKKILWFNLPGTGKCYMFYSVCFLQYSPLLRGLILKQFFERVMFQFYIMLKKLFNDFINCVNKMPSFLD